jgi:hypothetical protein
MAKRRGPVLNLGLPPSPRHGTITGGTRPTWSIENCYVNAGSSRLPRARIPFPAYIIHASKADLLRRTRANVR